MLVLVSAVLPTILFDGLLAEVIFGLCLLCNTLHNRMKTYIMHLGDFARYLTSPHLTLS
jgi:hypothetical protein